LSRFVTNLLSSECAQAALKHHRRKATTQPPLEKHMNTTKLLISAVTVALAGAVAVPAFAGAASAPEGKWAKHHPRREQVNKRLANQDKRIHEERKEGELTKGQAAALHKDDLQIRQEERDMSSQNGGHITKQEQKTLNQQENAVSKKIGQ